MTTTPLRNQQEPQRENVEVPQWLVWVVIIAAVIGLMVWIGPGPTPPGPEPDGPLTVVLVKDLGAPMTQEQVDELAKLRLEMDNWRKQDEAAAWAV